MMMLPNVIIVISVFIKLGHPISSFPEDDNNNNNDDNNNSNDSNDNNNSSSSISNYQI